MGDASRETNRRALRVITDSQDGLMLLWLRRSALVAILAIVFLLGFFIGRRSVTRGARFKQEQWAIDVAADYLQKKGIS